MRKTIFIAVLVLVTMQANSQENMVTINGGYSFANIEDRDTKGTGWRINGLYEYNPQGGMLAHGVSFGYINLTSEEAGISQSGKVTVNSFPLYYAPKLMFGGDRLKAYVKGVLGMQFASLKWERYAELDDSDFGFYGGGGAGIMVNLGEKIFINAEYEIAWASNSWYKDGWMNTAMGGIGFKF